MTTLSVPFPEDLLKKIQALIDLGVAENKAALIRKAVDKYVEEQVIESILKAQKEPRLKGNLDDLARKLAA